MTGEESSALPRRRTASKSVNYNEKDTDAKLAKRIEQLEEARALHHSDKPRRGRGGGIATNCSANTTDRLRYQKFLNDKSVGWNFIPSVPPFFRKSSRFSTVLDLEDASVDVEKQLLYNTETLLLKANDTIYMVSEPPGEPYYIGRVVEFVCKSEFRGIISTAAADLKKFPVKFFEVRMNWFYRPRDIQNRMNNLDPRLLYASLHQDVCPIESYRGKCLIVHEDDIGKRTCDKLDHFTKSNNFYFNQLFDRYTRKYYKVIPTETLLKLQNTSPFLCALNKRFRYIYVEENYLLDEVLQKYVLKEGHATYRDDELWSERCSVCREWCTKPLSLRCDECTQAVHLYCMDTPLDRKPNKGVIWLCFGCVKRQEGTVEALEELKEDEIQEEEFFALARRNLNETATREARKSGSTEEECFWIQYMGRNMVNHLDDLMRANLFLPYPIKTSRVGYKYQWSGCMDDGSIFPKPYSSDSTSIERGTDTSSELLWDMSNASVTANDVDAYMKRCKAEFPPKLGMLPESCNFLDMAVTTLMNKNFNIDLAFQQCGEKLSRELLQEPTFTPEEIKRFEDGVTEFGSELLPVSRCVKTQPMSMIVRYYYNWKKTPNGRKIWGNYKGRRKNMGKKPSKSKTQDAQSEERKSKRDRKPTKLALESQLNKSPANLKYVDDSSFETENISSLKKCFHCMFCQLDYSPMWYKITGGSDDDCIKHRMQTCVNEKTETSDASLLSNKDVSFKSKENQNEKLDALCIRCARLWRRYGVKWQSPLTVLKSLNGPSVASLHATLELIFSDTNGTALQLSPQQARNKFLEWELVQDSELISRQREEMIKNPERLVKMKKSTMAARAQLCKMVKRPFDIVTRSRDRMVSDLKSYVEMHRLKVQEVKPSSQSCKTPRNIAHSMPKEPEIHGNIAENREKNAAGDRSPPIDLKNGFRLDLLSSYDIQIKVPYDSGNLGKITLDTNAEYLRMDDKIYTRLLAHMNPQKRSKENGLSDEIISNKKLKKADPPKLDNDKKSCMDKLKALNNSTIPVLTNENNTEEFLRNYYGKNPFYADVSSEPLPGNDMKDNKELCSSLSSRHGLKKTKIMETMYSCCVCGENFSETTDEEIFCHNCGLRVHYYCYGVSIPQDMSLKGKLKNYKWFCDPCSNDVHPIVSTNYQCDLCYSKKSDDNLVRGPIEHFSMDALKCTTGGSWAHVICALFEPDIKFGSAKFLQPIINIKFTLAKNLKQTCEICELEGGGLIKCEFCSVIFHASCAKRTPGFELKMKKIGHMNSTNNTKDEESILLSDGKKYILSPAAFCSKHQSEIYELADHFFPLNWRITNRSGTLLQLFCENYKDYSEKSTIYTRYLEQQSVSRGNFLENAIQPAKKGVRHEITSEENIDSGKNCAKICSRCRTEKSIFWYHDICHMCHVSQTSHLNELIDISESDVVEDAQMPPRISQADTASLLDVLTPVESDTKIEKNDKNETKYAFAKIPVRKTKWVKENLGK